MFKYTHKKYDAFDILVINLKKQQFKSIYCIENSDADSGAPYLTLSGFT